LERRGAQFGWIGNRAARIVLLAAAVFGCLAWAPEARAQSVVVTVSTVPNGASFMVDNGLYYTAQSFVWAVGSRHALIVATTVQPYLGAPTVYTFQDWTWPGGGSDPSAEIFVNASVGVTNYVANFDATNALTTVVSNVCGPIVCGGVPGTIQIGGTATTGTVAVPFGSTQVLTAVPNPGYAFVSWSPGANQVISGATDTATMIKPVTATANFTVAIPVTFATVPANMQLVVDTVPSTGSFTEWLAWGSSHLVSAVSSQRDVAGNYWVFLSWDDGGAINHVFTVPVTADQVTLTATFVPASVSTFLISPPNMGLSLTVDGRNNYTVWSFAWAAGSIHTFSAPATQRDGQGNLWGFVGWSNGGSAAQTLTVGTTGGTYTANYQQLSQLTVTSSLAGVPVTVNGSSCATPCTVQQPVGTSVTVTAPASVPVGAGSRQDLLNWSTGTTGTSVTLAAPGKATTLTANYHLMNQLALTVNPAGAATWSVQPASSDGFYSAGTVVNISLSAKPGYQFRNWSGDLNGIAPFGTLVMTQPRSVSALMASVPYLPTGAVENVVGVTPTSAVAPGSAIAILGVNLTSSTLESAASPLPQTLGGVTVSVGSRLLPLYFVSPGQINAQLPADLPLGAATLVVTTEDGSQVTAKFTIAQDAPGLFTLESNDKPYALAFHKNGTLVTETAPAQVGETLRLYGTGFGPTTPMRVEGLAVPNAPSFVITDPVSVQVNGASFLSSSAYALPGGVSVDVVEFALTPPNTPAPGDFPLTVTVNKVVSNTVLLPIE
jgi:uncharacterized protein (TIGR03437 family)